MAKGDLIFHLIHFWEMEVPQSDLVTHGVVRTQVLYPETGSFSYLNNANQIQENGLCLFHTIGISEN
jgi:hypothetical protein